MTQERHEMDEDVRTNILSAEIKKKRFSTIKNKTLKLVSTITGAQVASRRKVFYDIQSNSDLMIWDVVYEDKVKKCIKVFNPAILFDKSSEYLKSIRNAQRLEIEDPERLITVLPKHLEPVNLEAFVLTLTRVKSLPKCFYHHKLKYLDLQRNTVRRFKGIDQAINLMILNLSNNQIHILPKTLVHLKHLIDLNISCNYLHEIPDFLPLFTLLKVLNCSNNQLRRLPLTLGNTTSLTTLDISSNQITDLPFSIGELINLLDFRASSNWLSHLPKSFANLKKLKCLNLRKNRFVKTPVELKELQSLRILNLKDNRVTDFAYVIPSLRHLNLDKNQLKDIPLQLLESTKLETISFQFNHISHFPVTIAPSTSLKVLYLSNNPLKSLPESISNIESLKQLHLSNTQITTLPFSLRNMTNLSHLSLDDCPNIDIYLRLEYKASGTQGVKDYLTDSVIQNDQKFDLYDTQQFDDPLPTNPHLENQKSAETTSKTNAFSQIQISVTDEEGVTTPPPSSPISSTICPTYRINSVYPSVKKSNIFPTVSNLASVGDPRVTSKLKRMAVSFFQMGKRSSLFPLESKNSSGGDVCGVVEGVVVLRDKNCNNNNINSYNNNNNNNTIGNSDDGLIDIDDDDGEDNGGGDYGEKNYGYNGGYKGARNGGDDEDDEDDEFDGDEDNVTRKSLSPLVYANARVKSIILSSDKRKRFSRV